MKKFISYFIFYLIQFTWGILLNIFGLLMALFMLITFHKPHRLGTSFYFVCKKLKGFGIEGGVFVVLGADCDGDEIILHELGHGIQNFWFGPVFPFIVGIPSIIRYWYREIKYYRKGLEPKTDYDAVWFEGTATKWGTKRYKRLFDEKFKKGDQQ